MRNDIHYKVWVKIIHYSQRFTGATIEVWERIRKTAKYFKWHFDIIFVSEPIMKRVTMWGISVEFKLLGTFQQDIYL